MVQYWVQSRMLEICSYNCAKSTSNKVGVDFRMLIVALS